MPVSNASSFAVHRTRATVSHYDSLTREVEEIVTVLTVHAAANVVVQVELTICLLSRVFVMGEHEDSVCTHQPIGFIFV
ncbi:hypothetical protein TNCV_2107771 [Trichonephila clavipes]|nr:hypothetical protein TNCV_2107771 [Trichonephila clavipes]